MRKDGLTILEFIAASLLTFIVIALVYSAYMYSTRSICTGGNIAGCFINVKQIGGALHQYQIDFNQIPTIHADPEQIHASQEEVARSLALLFTSGYADSPSLFECPVEPLRRDNWRTEFPRLSFDSMSSDEAFAAALALVDPEQGTSYLLTPNLHMQDRSNKPVLADRGGKATADGYTTNHGDTDTTRGEWGGTVLRMDNSQQTIRNPDGYIPHSPGNETIPLWINTNTDTTPLTDRNRAAIWK